MDGFNVVLGIGWVEDYMMTKRKVKDGIIRSRGSKDNYLV